MLWHQIYDEPLSNKKSDYNDYWEDYTCSIQLTDLALETSLSKRID